MTEPRDTLHFLDYWRVISSRKEIVAAVLLIVVASGVLVTYRMPKVYMASVIIQVKEDAPDLPIFSPQMIRSDPLFLRTQFELIQSAPILEEVIRKLNLNEKLGKAYEYYDVLGEEKSFHQTFRILSRAMRVQQYRETNLIQVRVFLSEPKDTAPQIVADVANEICRVYRSLSMERNRGTVERALQVLRDSLEEQEKKVAEAEAKVAEIREKHQINIVSSSAGTDSALTKMTLMQLENNRIEARLDLEGKRARYEKFVSLPMNERIEAGPRLLEDAALDRLLAQKVTVDLDWSRLQMTALGPKHPDVVRLEGVKKELESKIEEKLKGMETALLHEYETSQAKLTALEQLLESIKTEERMSESTGYREFSRARESLDHARRLRDQLELRYIEERIELKIPSSPVEVVEPAKVPEEDRPVSPNFLLNIVLSVLLGLSAGVGLAFFVEYMDTSVKTIEEVEQAMKVPVLGVIPQKVKPFSEKMSDKAHEEAYRVLRTNIRFSKKLNNGKTLCVTSGSVSEGKSLTLFNLAVTCAQSGDRTLIVDCDLHRPRQHKLVGVSNDLGLTNLLLGESALEDLIVASRIPNLEFLPSGRMAAGSHGLLATVRLQELIQELKSRYDLIFFDAPPMIGISDTSLVVREMDAVLLVIQHRKYPRAVSIRTRDMIEQAGGNLLGVVLNNINVAKDHTYYYYQQHYNYYPGHNTKERKA